MQRYTIFFIIVNALHVSGGFSAHHQELKNCTHSIWYVPGLLAATASGLQDAVASCKPEHITLSSTPDQQLEKHSTKYHRQQPLYNTLELLMMGIVVPETC